MADSGPSENVRRFQELVSADELAFIETVIAQPTIPTGDQEKINNLANALDGKGWPFKSKRLRFG